MDSKCKCVFSFYLQQKVQWVTCAYVSMNFITVKNIHALTALVELISWNCEVDMVDRFKFRLHNSIFGYAQ